MKDPKADPFVLDLKTIRERARSPTFDPALVAKRSHVEYVAGVDLRDMLREDLIAERIAIDTYREIVGFLGNHDSTTRRMVEDVLTQEEEHADELSDFLQRFPVASER